MGKNINGLVFAGDMNDMVVLSQAIRKAFIPMAMDRMAIFLGKDVAYRMDHDRFVAVPPCFGLVNYMSKAYQDLQERTRKLEAGEADPQVDLSCEICFIPFQGRVYGLLYGDWRKELLAMPGIQDWHYQDSTDRPEEITRLEWADRARIWGEIFASSYVPSDLGLVAKIIRNDSRHGPTAQMIEDHQPDIGKRASRIAREAAIAEHFRRLPQGLHTPGELMKWLDTPYAATRMTTLTTEFALQMSPLTQAQMLGKEAMK